MSMLSPIFINNLMSTTGIFTSIELYQTNSFNRSPQYLRNDLYVLYSIWPSHLFYFAAEFGWCCELCNKTFCCQTVQCGYFSTLGTKNYLIFFECTKIFENIWTHPFQISAIVRVSHSWAYYMSHARENHGTANQNIFKKKFAPQLSWKNSVGFWIAFQILVN